MSTKTVHYFYLHFLDCDFKQLVICLSTICSSFLCVWISILLFKFFFIQLLFCVNRQNLFACYRNWTLSVFCVVLFSDSIVCLFALIFVFFFKYVTIKYDTASGSCISYSLPPQYWIYNLDSFQRFLFYFSHLRPCNLESLVVHTMG